MLALLFDFSFWYDLIIAIGLIFIILTCLRFKGGQIFLAVSSIILLVVSSVLSVVYINNYLSAKGGIIGSITGVFRPNEINVQAEELSFDFKNIMLTETADKNIYKAKFVGNEVLELGSDLFYGVFVNGQPCTFVENSVDYIVADYSYNFYDKDKEFMLNDTLRFHFSFHKKQCEFLVTTNGGSAAVKYWNSYFNKNAFKVEVKAIDEYMDSVAFDNYGLVQFKVKNEIVNKQLVQLGTNANDFIVDNTKDYIFNYWTLDSVNSVSVAEIEINGDTTFIANVTNKYNVRYFIRNKVSKTEVVLDGSVARSVPQDTNSFKIKYWTLDKLNAVDLTTFKITQNVDFYAVISEKFRVDFIKNLKSIKSEYVVENEYVKNYEISDPNFLGWSTDLKNIINVSSVKVTNNVRLYAMYSDDYINKATTYLFAKIMDEYCKMPDFKNYGVITVGTSVNFTSDTIRINNCEFYNMETGNKIKGSLFGTAMFLNSGSLTDISNLFNDIKNGNSVNISEFMKLVDEFVSDISFTGIA